MGTCSRLSVITVASLLVAAACGQSDDPSVRSASELPAAPDPAAPVAGAPTSTPGTTATTAPSTAAASTTTTLPGEPFDYPFASAGAMLDVVGIAFDETLDLHDLPGSTQPVVASLPPLTRGVVSEGRAQSVSGDGIWLEVTASGTTGWTSPSNLAYLGGVRDATATVVAELGGRPTAPSMLELGDIVNGVVVPSDPAAPPADIVMAAAPGSGSTAEVVYDTFPGEFFGDDAASGSRVVVTGRQVTAGSLPPTGVRSSVVYELVRVDTLSLCTRGVTTDGLCV